MMKNLVNIEKLKNILKNNFKNKNVNNLGIYNTVIIPS